MTAAGQPRAPARLSRPGFTDARRAADLLAGLRLWDLGADHPVDKAAGRVVEALARVGDPDLALLALVRLVEVAPDADELLARLAGSAGLRGRLLGVLGASQALGDHLVANPGQWRRLVSEDNAASRPTALALTRELCRAAGVDPDEPDGPAGGAGSAEPTGQGGTPAAVRALRTAYRGALLDLTGRDLTGSAAMEDAAAELSDLAAATLTAALALARSGLAVEAPECRLAVIGLGKCGGRELNYVSDVDVVFVAEPPAEGVSDDAALQTATHLATEMMRICALVAWPVDAALRPEGKSGALVRTLTSHESYYRRWARTWEFQALLKMRPVAGDADLGRRYVEALQPLVWTAAEREGFVEDVQQMRRRVEETLPAAIASRELKLGPGGLRDVEFAVQLLQLVHGRAEESLRSPTTLSALQALSAGGYVGRADAETLAAAYRFLRTVEHRLQLQRLRRTHLLPEDVAERRWLARSLGFSAGGGSSALELFDAEHAAHAREVRRLHEKLFYRPLLLAVARVPGEELRMSPEAAGGRLGALGYADPDGALRHIEALTAGVTRKASMQRLLLPAMLRILADSPAPDAGLLAYRHVSEQLGSSPWYLRLLRDEGQVAERLATLLGSSRYVADLIARAPEALRLLADDDELLPRPGAALASAMCSTAARHEEPAAAVLAVRRLRRHELLRIACADLLERCDVEDVGTALSAVATATLQAALTVAHREVADDGAELPTRFAVIALGRLGGGELGYGSDADVMFVHDPLPEVSEQVAGDAAHAVAEQLRALLAAPAPDPPLLVDAGLRPEGRNGPLVRSLASYREYYARWSSVWEAQALLRAAPVAGDPDLGRRFIELIDPIRYPAAGLSAADATEIRRIKARVDAERLPRGADPATHTKLGRGGLGDVEWTVQMLQLQHAARVPALRSASTLAALRSAAEAGLLQADQAAALEASWRFATRCRNAIMLVRGRAGDQLPRTGRDLAGVARAVGYPPGRDPGVFLDDYRRAARRARGVVEKVFYASL
ncbi:MAG: bifunctional [glutamine synthetase] adenylyltransferase/[glutamine synthetase]-adenylyl-L-tyrosine phosphorylase [Geodermatophilaceae bacterium]|nr:bifunctional [glutamine synthetase] adenylyltransferase/[glutamine synthetase]-adenylyl-L-tyrosine phosphorylase [Geodermatophilaceae bacterium]